jgi:hypothetical protein
MKTNGQNLHSFLPMDADGGVAWQQSPQEEKSVLENKVMLSIHCHFLVLKL